MKTQPTTHLSRHFALCLQAWRLVRTQPVLAAVSVLGTAFAIAMIMVIVLTWQLKYSDVYPETHRSRTLFVSALGLANRSYGYSSALFMRDCVEGLPGVETCTAYSFASDALVTLPAGSGQRLRVDAKQTAPEFWRVFPFRFVSGTGFSQADFESGRPSAVLCESVARRLFGRTDVAGEYIVLNRSHMRVAGVVPDVSLTARDAYAQLWWLYPYSERHTRGDYTTYLGNMTVAMLVSSRDSMQAVRAGVQRRVKLLNEGAMKDTPLWIGDQPDDIRTHLNHVWANVGPDMTMFYVEHALLLLLVLLVPALNLSGLNHSRDGRAQGFRGHPPLACAEDAAREYAPDVGRRPGGACPELPRPVSAARLAIFRLCRHRLARPVQPQLAGTLQPHGLLAGLPLLLCHQRAQRHRARPRRHSAAHSRGPERQVARAASIHPISPYP